MKRMMWVIALAAVVAGCAHVDPIAQQEAQRQQEQNRVMGDIARSNQQELQKIEARRAAYLKQNPSYAFASDVKRGIIVNGMTMAAVEAAGYHCDMSETSTIGSVYTCTNMRQAFESISADPPAVTIGFDSDGFVDSVLSP